MTGRRAGSRVMRVRELVLSLTSCNTLIERVDPAPCLGCRDCGTTGVVELFLRV